MAPEIIMQPVHPGEILLEEFLAPLSLSQYQLAKEISVPARRINEIVHGQRRITADDIEVERDRLGDTLDDIKPISAAG
jgi:antitoxin HigA-1